VATVRAVDRARDLVVDAMDGRLLERLGCGCEIYDAAGYAVVVGEDCELDHYRDVQHAIEEDGE
jgi:hypothetical protein